MTRSEAKHVEDFHRQRWAEMGFEALEVFEKNYIGVWWLMGEVANGGMHQFLTNSSGDLAPYAEKCLEEIGDLHGLSLLQEALAMIPGGWCADRNTREDRISQIPCEVDAFESVSERLQKHLSEVDRLSAEYLQSHYRSRGLLR